MNRFEVLLCWVLMVLCSVGIWVLAIRFVQRLVQ